MIVAQDADLDDALPLLAKGGFYHAGQVCVSVQRVFAHSAVFADVSERLAALAGILRVGNPLKEETDVGPLIRHRETERVTAWVDEAVRGGADLLQGGERLSPSLYAPTVLANPPEQAAVSRKEVFGPVICLYEYDELDDAVRRSKAQRVPGASLERSIHPILALPMKLKNATRASVTNFSATDRSETATAWHQPSGSPASLSRPTNSKQIAGVSCAGLMMTGQPLASPRFPP